MWCETVLRNSKDETKPEPHGRLVDYLEIPWGDCGNVVKRKTVGGEPVRILLRAGERLRHGDVVFEDASRVVIVRVLPCEVIVATTPNVRSLAVLAMELGNLHLPAEVGNDSIIFVEDGAAMALLDSMNIHWTRELRRFEPTPIVSAPRVSRGKIQVIRGSR